MLCNNRVSLDIMIYCNLRLLYWLYPLYGFIGTYFLRYIHELISFIHFMMNSFSLVHVCLYFDNRLSLDMIGMFHISYYTVIPMLYQRLHVVIIHRQFFFLGTRFHSLVIVRLSASLIYGLQVSSFLILLYRSNTSKNISLFQKPGHF